ncbi:hypothetical protein, partial [Salmonella enterica]|uniref:hypothetical protein n=1 Tax=Salmonella enterica TaxID=28901 RepID=UPI0026DC384C
LLSMPGLPDEMLWFHSSKSPYGTFPETTFIDARPSGRNAMVSFIKVSLWDIPGDDAAHLSGLQIHAIR